MSLLIKALQKAEQEKTADEKNSASGGELSLELAPAHTSAPEPSSGLDSDLNNEAGFSQPSTSQTVPVRNQKQVSQQAAATMFAAKSVPTNKAGLSKSAVLAGAALLLLLLLGGGFYFYLNSLNQPELAMPNRVAAAPPAATQEPAVTDSVAATADSVETEQAASAGASDHAVENAASKSSIGHASNANEESAPAENELNVATASPRKAVRESARSQQLTFGEPIEAGADTPVAVTRNQPVVGINPDLISAYSAFKAGDDAAAQRYYRQVLHGDVRNVDALLGMAAIAARQGRSNDALGWYSKVLEVEPRNNVAQAAMVSVMAQADPIGGESRIKNLLAQQPEAAYLHAALGGMYAGQNQWPLAQQSYFQALHFDAKNAEYAFNLAVSLDHLGKAALALQYYKTTLELLSKSGIGNIDRTQVESRIAQLE